MTTVMKHNLFILQCVQKSNFLSLYCHSQLLAKMENGALIDNSSKLNNNYYCCQQKKFGVDQLFFIFSDYFFTFSEILCIPFNYSFLSKS